MSRLVHAVICLQEAAVLGYDASTKMVKLKLSEATLKQEMQKGKNFLMKYFLLSIICSSFSKQESEREVHINGRTTGATSRLPGNGVCMCKCVVSVSV